ncbi:MAG: HAD-IA family hydrolase [Clostridiales bacterium]|nr:HAD-IA family hydrolase [Clostridiales bacterium]
MRYDSIIYDFDGTLSDTYPCFTEAVLETCRHFGVECSYRRAYDLLKISVGTAIQTIGFGDVPYAEVNRVFHEYHNILAVTDQKPFPEAEPLLRELVARGGRNIIYSHSGIIVPQLVAIWGWKDLFAGILDGRTRLPRKPAPDGINLICEKYGLDKEKTLMVGDRDIDIDAGRNAGVDGCLFDPEHYYDSATADYRVYSLSDILPIVS